LEVVEICQGGCARVVTAHVYDFQGATKATWIERDAELSILNVRLGLLLL